MAILEGIPSCNWLILFVITVTLILTVSQASCQLWAGGPPLITMLRLCAISVLFNLL